MDRNNELSKEHPQNVIIAELKNRLFKMGIIDRASVGALIPDGIGAVNQTVFNSIGKNVKIEKVNGKIQIADEQLRYEMESWLFEEDPDNGEIKLRFETLAGAINHLIRHLSLSRDGASFNTSDFTDNFSMYRRVFTGATDFVNPSENTKLSCMEFVATLALLSSIYYPNTSFALIPFKVEQYSGIKGVVEGIADQHTYGIFKDNDGEVYIYIYGDSHVKRFEDAINLLERYLSKNSDPDSKKRIESIIETARERAKELD